MDEKSVKNYISYVSGMIDMVKSYKDNQTFCLITSDNPMGQEYSAEENNKRRAKLENDLKEIHRLYTKLKGAYGNDEKTFLIINITLTECMWLAKTYQQESFVFGKKENGKMIYHYYKTSDGKNYKDIEQSDAILNQSDADQFFTLIHNFKFKMDFKLEFVENMQKVFYERYSWNPKFEENFKRYMEENMTIKHYYFENFFLMETKEHFMKRLERLTSSGSENLDEYEVTLYRKLSQKESSDPKVYYMRHGIKFICRESQCKERGIKDYSKLED